MKLVTLLALASMTATAAPAFADSIVPGSDAAFYAQATPAPSTSTTTARYGMPRTATMGAALTPASDSDLVPGSDAAFAGPAPKAGAVAQHRATQPATTISPDIVPGSDASFLN